MTATLHATPDPATGRVRLDGAGWTVGEQVLVTRTNPDGTVTAVRGAAPLDALAATFTVWDAEVPLGQACSWTAQGTVTTAPAVTTATLDAAGPLLTHPDTGGTLAVRIVDDRPQWDLGRSTVHQVIGRADPIVTGALGLRRAGTLTLAARDVADSDALVRMWSQGVPLLLRTPCGSILRDGWLAGQRLTEGVVNPRCGPRTLAVDYQQVGRPFDVGVHDEPWVYADVLDTFAAYASLPGMFASYRDLMAGPVRA